MITESVHDRLGTAFQLCRDDVLRFVERAFRQIHKDRWREQIPRAHLSNDSQHDDLARLLSALLQQKTLFRTCIEKVGGATINSIILARHRWAHQERLGSAEAERVLKAIERLLRVLGSPQADIIAQLRLGLQLSLE